MHLPKTIFGIHILLQKMKTDVEKARRDDIFEGLHFVFSGTSNTTQIFTGKIFRCVMKLDICGVIYSKRFGHATAYFMVERPRSSEVRLGLTLC